MAYLHPFEKFYQYITDHAAKRCKERNVSPIWVRQQLAMHRPFLQGVHEWALPGNDITIVYCDVRKNSGGAGRRRHVITVYHRTQNRSDRNEISSWERSIRLYEMPEAVVMALGGGFESEASEQ